MEATLRKLFNLSQSGEISSEDFEAIFSLVSEKSVKASQKISDGKSISRIEKRAHEMVADWSKD